jgi:hypothetical protein
VNVLLRLGLLFQIAASAETSEIGRLPEGYTDNADERFKCLLVVAKFVGEVSLFNA